MQSKTVSPLLKPKHFEGLAVQLTHQGLSLDTHVGPDERTEEIFQIGSGEKDTDDALAEIEKLRLYTRVVANPQQPSAGSLLKILRHAQECLIPDEAISIIPGPQYPPA